MVILTILRFLLKLLLKLIYIPLFVLNMVFVFIAGLGAITQAIGKILLAIAAFCMIVTTLPHLFSLPEITLKDVWENVLIWLVIPLPLLFLTNIALLVSKGIIALQDKINTATFELSQPMRGTKKYYAENIQAYHRHMRELEEQKNNGSKVDRLY